MQSGTFLAERGPGWAMQAPGTVILGNSVP